MPPSPHPTKPPSPKNHHIFDLWNSSSTGHQRSENPYSNSTAWKETRSRKLGLQFRNGDCLSAQDAERRAASRAFDGTCGSRSPSPRAGKGTGEWKWVSEEEAKRTAMGVRDIRGFMGISKRKAGDQDQGGGEKRVKVDEARLSTGKVQTRGLDVDVDETGASASASASAPATRSISTSTSTPSSTDKTQTQTTTTAKSKPIFSGTTIYINGSTLPQISDHKLKHLLVAHGAQISISMARKTVSHVIVGQPNSSASTKTGAGGDSNSNRNGNGNFIGAGGGLAARKIQQEIARGGWKGVKIVGVDWVLESVKAGRRLAESRFGVVDVAGVGQKSVASMFGR